MSFSSPQQPFLAVVLTAALSLVNGISAHAQSTPLPTTLTPDPLTVSVGATGTLTATLSPTPTAPGALSVSSSNPSVATVPASVSFASGQASVPVPVTAVGTGNTRITVSLNGGSATATVQVTSAPPTVTSLVPSTLTITQGGSGTLTVTISAAQTTDTTVALTSTAPGIAFVPSSVTVPAGQTSAPITVSANTAGTAQITASVNGSSVTSLVTVTPALPTIVSLLPPTNPVTRGATTTLTVTISAAQPTDTDLVVSATPAGIVTVLASVTVPAGQTSVPIPVSAVALGTAAVQASLNGTSAEAAVQVLAPVPALVAVLPPLLPVVVNATGTLTVLLNEAQLTTTTLALSVDQATVLELQASVTVPAGQTQASFTVTGLAVGTATVTATLNAPTPTTKTAQVRVVPPPPTVVSLLPSPLPLEPGATGTLVLLLNAAQLADTVIPLTNSAPSVLEAPSAVTVPAGQLSVTVPVRGRTGGSATLTAALNGTSARATVQVTPLPTVVTGLVPGTVTVPKGTPGVLLVLVSPGSTDPQSVSLTSSLPTVADVPATVPVPAGALGAVFPVLSVGEGSATITATLNGRSASAQVTVTAAQFVALMISPQTPTIVVGQSQPFTATTTFTDGTTQDVTTSVTWTSSNPSVATITASGVASGLAGGTTTITATSGSNHASTTLTVLTAQPPTITSYTPSQGKAGTNVTITGQNFDPVPANNQVKFAGVSAAVLSATSTTLIATVPPTAMTGLISVTTAGGTAQSATNFTVIPITGFSVTPALATLPIGSTQQVRSIATFADLTTQDVTSFTTWVSSNSNVASVTSGGLAQGVAQGTATITGSLGTLSGSASVQVIADTGGGPLPPDPATVAPSIDPTALTPLVDATAFLYTGGNPIQTGVVPGTIEAKRAAVLRGHVRGRDGFPIPGVTITVLNHAEFGQTLTRPDGMFDLAVNGGGLLTVKYDKAGYLPAQRQVRVTWQDYVMAPEVVLTTLDPQVTSINLAAPTGQTARGSVMTDSDGTRQATLLFSPDTTAVMTLPNGSTQPLTNLSVRATEYTVNADGPKAMPAELPPTSAYTYAVEYSVDEMMSAGATTVQFSQPVISYVENFLNFPVGTPIPSGYYDRTKGLWVASTNGQVIKILSITAGAADVDTDGDGLADSGLGITSAERQRLASLYQPGQSLWRVPVHHFSAWDYNLGFGPPLDAIFSKLLKFIKFLFVNDQCEVPGSSVIGCENQALGESVPLTGTPFQLHYQSDRVAGRKESFSLEIPVSGSTLPASLKRIDLEITVAGRTFPQSFPATPNQRTTFTWDGLDAYGRRLQGNHPIIVQLKYVYDAVYTRVERFASSTGNITTVPTRREVNLVESWQGTLGLFHAQAARLGGWTLSAHHAYDPFGHVLDLGTGERRKAEGLPPVLMTLAGTGSAGFSGDNGPATQAQLSYPAGIGPTPDGGFYLVDAGRIRRVSPTGIITTVAGTGVSGSSGDGGPATQAQIMPNGLGVGPDGAYYIVEYYTHRVRRVGTDGMITTVVGTGTPGFNGDGILATQAQLNNPRDIIVGSDNSLYITDSGNNRVRRVGPDGIITTVAGTGAGSYGGDGGPATQAHLYNPSAIAIGPDGSLYVADVYNNRIRRVGPNGMITTVAGTGAAGSGGDGGPATAAQLHSPYGVTLVPDGSLYIADYYSQRVRRVGPDGIITTVAGNGDTGVSADGFPATQGPLSFPYGGALGADGHVYFSDYNTYRIRRLASPFPGFSVGDILVPSKDGSELYRFTSAGQHLQTLDGLAGAGKYQFGYDGNGLLASVTDGAGQVTTIERDGTGTATAIVAPGGQRTALSLEGNGYLASITNPAGETTQFTYSADGLLATLTDPRSGLRQYTYDAQGRLSKDQDPADGFKALTRTEQSAGWTVALSTALNRTTSYQVENLSTGDLRRRVTDASGLLTTTLSKMDGTTTLTAPDGTVTTSVQGPDPRFGMQAPILSSLSVRLPSTLTSTLTTTRAVTLSNPNDPLSLTSQTDTLVINGRTYTSSFNQSAKTITTTTPAGRVSTVTLDAKGRVVQEQVTGLEAVSYTYDTQGRLSTITQGTGATARTSTLSYNTKNELISITDPLTRTVGFAYDLAGRITTQTLPDLRTIGYAYDGNGNVTSITPPGRPSHVFAYTPVDLESNYTPPDVGFSPRNTQYSYNLDRQLTLVTRPDGQALSLGYDTGGRLNTLTLPGSTTITYAYDATKGTLNSITAPNSTLSYTYDGSLLTNTTWAGAVAGSVSRVYDTNFRISSQSVNGANTVSFGFDNDSLLTSAGSLTISRSAENGLITDSTLGAVTDSRTYSTFGELSSYTANVSGSPVFNVTYTRDKLGRITQKAETITGTTNTFVYTYDTAGRLTDVTKNGAVVGQYTYDSNGNRLSQTDAAGTVNGTYDAQDRLTQYGNLQFTYTANGELLNKNNPVLGQTATFSYDVLGNLKSVSLPGSLLVEYVVDGQNRRIGKKVNGALVQGFLYQNQLNPVAELDGAGTVVSRFVYGTKANVADYMMKGGVTYRIVSDHLGSPRLVINTADGTVAQRMDFDEFGNITADTNPGFQPFGFAGGLYDQHTGLTRFGARDYDAQVGRWSAKDQILFAGLDTNLYGYVLNDPVNILDPSGLRPGDPYHTVDEAGIAAVSDINPTSIEEGLEYAGRIYQRADGKFSYTEPRKGTASESDIGPLPPGTTHAGDYHTHGYGPPGSFEEFSNQDKRSNDALGAPGYLGTPSGAIKKYIPDPTFKQKGPTIQLRKRLRLGGCP